MGDLSKINFLYGENLTSDTPFLSGALYFDTAKKQIWYDDPSKTSGSHQLLTSLGEISMVTTLPSIGKHNDIVILKTLVTEGIYTHQIYIYDGIVEKTWIPLGQNFNDTGIIYTGETQGALTKGTNLSSNIISLQDAVSTTLENVAYINETDNENITTDIEAAKEELKDYIDEEIEKVTPVKGVDYFDGKSAYEIYRENGGELTEAQWLASFSHIAEPLFAEVIPDNADTSKLYVLPDTHMYAYFGKSVVIEENLFDPYSSDTIANKRLSSNTLIAAVGMVLSNFIPYDYTALNQLDRADKHYIKFTGLKSGIDSLYYSVGQGTYHTSINYYDSNKNQIGWSYIRYISSTPTIKDILAVWDDGKGNVYLDPTKQLISGYSSGFGFSFDDVKFIRMTFIPANSTASTTINDYKDTKIYLCGNERTEFKQGWYDTNITYPASATELDLTTLQNSIDDHELRIKDLEVNGSGGGGGSSSIPSYWENAIAEAETKISALQENGGADCVSFVWASDTHCLPNQSASGQNSTSRNVGRLANRLMNDLNIPFFAVTGDLSADVGSATTYPDKTDIDEFFDKIVAPVGEERVLPTLGNHDGTTYSTSGDRTISIAQRFNWFMRPFCGDNTKKWGGGEYYYADDTQGKIRFIALCGNNGSANIYRNNHYDGKQLKWLAEEALNTPNGYTVVVFSHFPSDGTSSSSSPTNSDVLMAILTAFDNKTSYTGTADGIVISKDFKESNATLCGLFAGHIHEDTINTAKGFPIITVDCAGNKTSIADRVFTNGSNNETAFDVVSINKESRTIYLTRLGVGADREISY